MIKSILYFVLIVVKSALTLGMTSRGSMPRYSVLATPSLSFNASLSTTAIRYSPLLYLLDIYKLSPSHSRPILMFVRFFLLILIPYFSRAAFRSVSIVFIERSLSANISIINKTDTLYLVANNPVLLCSCLIHTTR